MFFKTAAEYEFSADRSTAKVYWRGRLGRRYQAYLIHRMAGVWYVFGRSGAFVRFTSEAAAVNAIDAAVVNTAHRRFERAGLMERAVA